jgi:hypothetical protein
MRVALLLLAAVVVVVGLLPGTAGAIHVPDESFRMYELFTPPNQATNSDLVLSGQHAFRLLHGRCGITGRHPAARWTADLRHFESGGSPARQGRAVRRLQADPIVWDRNRNGVADLLLLAVDRTMSRPECGAPRSFTLGRVWGVRRSSPLAGFGSTARLAEFR